MHKLHYHKDLDLFCGVDRSQVKWYDKVAQGVTQFEPFCYGEVVLRCLGIKDNIKENNYYPIVKAGEVCNIVSSCSSGIFPFAKTICETALNGNYNKFRFDAENNGILLLHHYIRTDTAKEMAEKYNNLTNMLYLDDDDISVILHAAEIALQTCSDIKLVMFCGLPNDHIDEPDSIKHMSRAIEDFAEKNNVATIVFWDYQDPNCDDNEALIDYFSTHGHNVCFINLYDDKEEKEYFSFEFAGHFSPQIQYFEHDYEEEKLLINSDFNCLMMLRNFFAFVPNFIYRDKVKNQMLGYFGMSRKFKTISNYLGIAKAKKIVLQQGKKYGFNFDIDETLPHETH